MGEENGNIRNENGECRTFEENVYWTNFKSMRFFQYLSSDFHSQLMIPKKFSENLRDKLPQMVVLKSPGGAAWEVQLVKDSNGTFFFKDGWKEFAKAHDFKENDLLVFKYSRESCFKVWEFSGRNFCENASSYFVRKSAIGNYNASKNSQSKRKNTKEVFAEAAGNKENSGLENSDNECHPTGALRRKSRRHSVCGLSTEAKSPSTPYTSNSQLPTAEDKERALKMARREYTSESFIVVLKTTNVSQCYRLGVPAPWSRTYLDLKNQDMDLRADGKIWTVRFNLQPRCGGGVLVSGWSKFAVDNSLQESDVCLFKLVSQKGEPAVFDVHIFRASPEVAQKSHKPSSV